MSRKRPRRLSAYEKVQIAQALYEGGTPKAVASDWGIAISTVTRIQGHYIEYRAVWKFSCRYYQVCRYPACICIKYVPK